MRWAVVAVCVMAGAAESKLPRVLFLTHSAGYKHDVIPLAERQLAEAGRGAFVVDVTQDCGAMTAENLARYDAVAFYTTGELPFEAKVVVDYVKAGGGFVGFHCATDTFYKAPEYGEMIGGYFDGHPWHKKVNIKVEDKAHPATAHLGEAFEIVDEIYQFKDWERAKVNVLLSLDTSSVKLDMKGVNRADKDFAIAWTKAFGKGRVFYTALGHREEVWTDARFLTMARNATLWAMGRGPAAWPKPDEDVIAFDGAWKQAGPGGFKIEDGVATPHGGMGLYWLDREYTNFMLSIEFQQEKVSSNSGVFVRFPDPGDDPWVAVKQGYEVQIAGDKPGKNSTGAIYDFQAATAVPLRPAGAWNDYEITCIGTTYYVRLNGTLINTFTGDRSTKGRIGLQNHDDKSIVRYRNVRVRELPETATAYHVLFEGDRKGWKMCGPGDFELKEGALTAKGGMGMLWHEKSFKDFALLLEWRVRRQEDNSGVFVRFPDPGDDPWVAVNKGYELQVCDTAEAKHRTGSVYSFQDATEVPTKPAGEWNRYEIKVVGQKYEVRVNGKLVCEYTGDRSLEGFVGLQNHDDASAVSYRNIRVVELK